ncbi:prepilin-type N-terminal cleavage/methylation domain-containing protein [Amphritea opalescens]|uniref:Prepilin-type N-terminal cleavage/methylation domain-containing protein n=1 Tax=Amphritea opalescens TaxID=2490544 RepID=A0A430KLN6_9GAMM|nr:PilW family protein [Amphritea opalescens]RTE64372.1 prepilin-type N-terminal cleavage/methylation domain-containing protein [Amphritea opalescens]
MKSRYSPVKHSQQGFTLVELMISFVIGLLLTSAMLAAFVASARTYQLQDAMSEVQENGRFALGVLLKDLRQSGIDSSSGETVLGVENTAKTVENFEDKYGNLVISQRSIQSEIIYLPGLDTTYYVGDTGVGRPSLYRKDQPLVEGVEGLVLEYGIDEGDDNLVDSYKLLADMSKSDWGKVITVRFNLLLCSTGNGVSDRQQTLPSPFDGVDTSDRRLYQVYTATALLRNAVL